MIIKLLEILNKDEVFLEKNHDEYVILKSTKVL